MSKNIFLSKIKHYDPIKEEITLQLSYVTPEKQELLENLFNAQSGFKLNITGFKVRMLKTYLQLKEYFINIKLILMSYNVEPISENVKTLDDHFKKNVFEAEYMDLGDSRIPHTKSKANMTIDEMDMLIKAQREMYCDRVDFDNKEIIKKEG